MPKDKNGVIYEMRGRERDQLQAMFLQLIAQQEAFFGLVRFIAQREEIDLSQAQFDQQRLAFVRLPEKKEP